MTSFEAIVVVDGSEDGTRQVVESMSTPYRLVCVWQQNQGRAAACNTGIRAAAGDLIALLDDDMVPEETWLAAHMGAHERPEDVCVVGPVPVATDGGPSAATRHVGRRFERHLRRIASPGYQFGARDFYSGNASFPRDVLRRLGGFDESFVRYGNEDVELGIRLRQAGLAIVYCEAATAHQHHTKDLAGLAADALAKGRTCVHLARLHPEITPELALAGYGQPSPPWRSARRLLVESLGRSARARMFAIRAAESADRLGEARTMELYRLILDACFWAGVREELRSSGPLNDLSLPWP
jgi:glycosyltransferase involved in cell wall biosynthesis